MKLKVPFVFLFFVAMFLVSFPNFAQSSSQQDTLNQYIADLQKKPDILDLALLDKIIKLAQEMKPAPVIPAEAVKFADRGEYAAKTAKTESDYADAAEEYKKAMLIAPWVAEYWFNLGVLLEKANQSQRAANNFKLYLLAEPNAKDAREVQKRIAGLEYAAEKVAKPASTETVAAQNQNKAGETVFGTKWVEIPGTSGTSYIDAGSVVKQGNILIFWRLDVYTGPGGQYHGVVVAKSLMKAEIDLRVPRKNRLILTVNFDANDQQIAAPYYNPESRWLPVPGQCPTLDLALSYAKERQDTGAIPALVSDR